MLDLKDVDFNGFVQVNFILDFSCYMCFFLWQNDTTSNTNVALRWGKTQKFALPEL